MKKISALILLLAMPAALPLFAADAVPAFLQKAVADATRPAADTQRDAARKPAATMAFAGVEPRTTVVELIPGGGYFTRLLSKAVGPRGRVYAVVPAPAPNAPPDAPDRSAAAKAIAATPGYENVTVQVQPIRTLQLPQNADLVWTSDNYHDVHNVQGLDMLAFNKAVLGALKPGGIYLVIDHEAAADAPADVTSTLHRIRSDTVRQEVVAAGFEFAGRSEILHNPDDTHLLAVFDPAIRGKTDQFVLRFRKP